MGGIFSGCRKFSYQERENMNISQTGNLKVSSPAFSHQGKIPRNFTCDGNNVNPQLDFSGIPQNTQNLALIVDDPDAPMGTWTHWVIWNIDPQTTRIDENSVPINALKGKNSFGRLNYGGPCPPSGEHRYFFKLYALDTKLDLREGSTVKDLEVAMNGHILDSAELVGVYSRK